MCATLVPAIAHLVQSILTIILLIAVCLVYCRDDPVICAILPAPRMRRLRSFSADDVFVLQTGEGFG